jgi:hypothetical protein
VSGRRKHPEAIPFGTVLRHRLASEESIIMNCLHVVLFAGVVSIAFPSVSLASSGPFAAVTEAPSILI